VPLSDSAIWSLALAESALPEPERHIGFEAWITWVSGADCHEGELIVWASSLADAFSGLKPLRRRRRAMVQGYAPEWGHAMARDGLKIALQAGQPPSLRSRAEMFGVDRQPLRRVRSFIAGAVLLQMAQFESALEWAVRTQRH
jgi:hypothetical protein